ncbi:MAG TPA: hypothetical protein VN971_05255, partial [Thermoanaerobaculia bacterium]|nr:hypothetical protein [Thermoanaerobaculia bacterium]
AMTNRKRSRSTTARKKKKTVAKRAKTRRIKKGPGGKAAPRKAAGKRAPARKSAGTKKTRAPATRPARGRARPASAGRGLGPESGGQSGDTEGLSRAELADSESVEELLEEGQAFEAGVVRGVENAPGPEKGGVRTRQVPEDDVPQEYLDED